MIDGNLRPNFLFLFLCFICTGITGTIAQNCNVKRGPLKAGYASGCGGAVWWTGGVPSQTYCENLDGRFPWYKKCCKYTATGQCVPKNIDCNTKPDALKAGWPSGCAGAVWGSGANSESYCKNTGGDSKGRFGWYAHCCVWTGTTCAARNTDCDGLQCTTGHQNRGKCDNTDIAEKGIHSRTSFCCHWGVGVFGWFDDCARRGTTCVGNDRGSGMTNPGQVKTWTDVTCRKLGVADQWPFQRDECEEKHGNKCRKIPVMCSPGKNAGLVNRTTSFRVEFKWQVDYPSCTKKRGYWHSGCGQPAMEQKGVVRCYGNNLATLVDDAKCTGKKPDAATRICPATAKCPRCKGCKRDGGCWKTCGGKAGKCSACDSFDGRKGACCRYGATDDPKECELAEYQFAGGDHTCALLPDDHTGSMVMSIFARLTQLETAVKGLLGLSK